jgi:hypothetical protein
MEKTEVVRKFEKRVSETYHEPLLIKHEPLRDITGQKYSEKPEVDKTGNESF